MKSSSILFAAFAAVVFSTATGDLFAGPRAPEANGSDFIVAADDLAGWHVGGSYRYQSREISGGLNNLTQDTMGFHVGYDLLPWVSIYGIIGTVDNDLEFSFADSEYAVTYGGGAWVNFVDHNLLSTLALETKVRLSASAQMLVSQPEIAGRDCDYTDFRADLTFEIVNEIVGNKNVFADSVSLFFGPVYEKLDSDELDLTGDNLGMMFGIDLIVTPRVGISASYETFGSGDNAINISLDCAL